jgi:hypothetical protein
MADNMNLNNGIVSYYNEVARASKMSSGREKLCG